jgi:hypothetical protein
MVGDPHALRHRQIGGERDVRPSIHVMTASAVDEAARIRNMPGRHVIMI